MTNDAVSVTVTQADREAAADLLVGRSWLVSQSQPDWNDALMETLKAGKNDGYWLVQAFARHRLSAIAPGGAASVELREALFNFVNGFKAKPPRLGEWPDFKVWMEQAIAALATSSPVDAEKVRSEDVAFNEALDLAQTITEELMLEYDDSSPTIAVLGVAGSRIERLARPSHIGNGGEGGAIPAGMKRWHGGENAPEDWDGGAVLMRNGRFSIELSRGVAPDGKLKSGRWFWHKLPASDDIIAYTPKPTSAGKGGA